MTEQQPEDHDYTPAGHPAYKGFRMQELWVLCAVDPSDDQEGVMYDQDGPLMASDHRYLGERVVPALIQASNRWPEQEFRVKHFVGDDPLPIPASEWPADAAVREINDLALFLGGDVTSFTGKLLALIAKADTTNRSRLRIAYPYQLRAWEIWHTAWPVLTGAELTARLAADGFLTVPPRG